MPLMMSLRPPDKAVDFENSRFVVSSETGVNLADQKLMRGDEVPRGILSPRAMRAQYNCHRIDLLDYALENDPNLREACARRKAEKEPPQEEASQSPASVPTPVKPVFPKRR